MYFECNDPVSALARSIAYTREEIIRKIEEIEHQIEESRLTNGVESFVYNNGKLDGIKEALDVLNSYCTVVED